MTTQIEQIIDEALSAAKARASRLDVVCGVLAAMKRVYGTIEEIAGPNTMPMLDGCLRNRIILRSLRLGHGWAPPGRPLTLPLPGATAYAAETILISAADTCLATKSLLSDDGDVFLLVFVLTDRLFELLGGVPDAAELFLRIREDDEILLHDGEAMKAAPAVSRH